MIILKMMKNTISPKDLRVLKEIEDAWKEIEQGKSKTLTKGDFLKELKKW